MPFEPVRRPAPDVVLQGDDDEAAPLAPRWRDRPAVLVFLRHFG
ncbi:MAG TPA: hypothetical protein VKB65_06475 [Myxococcota bacterium]|nr:hypothetical protein [Myxococcota bacterium]